MALIFVVDCEMYLLNAEWLPEVQEMKIWYIPMNRLLNEITHLELDVCSKDVLQI
jgi:hypothetical protein